MGRTAEAAANIDRYRQPLIPDRSDLGGRRRTSPDKLLLSLLLSARSPLAAGRQSQMSPGLLVVTLPLAPFAFSCLDGVLRAAFLAFLGLLVLFAHISAKRVAI